MVVNACGTMVVMASRRDARQRRPGRCCSPLTGGVFDTAAAERLGGHVQGARRPGAVKLLSLIAASDGGEACICDLTEPLGLTQPTVSHHMKMLVDVGLVTATTGQVGVLPGQR